MTTEEPSTSTPRSRLRPRPRPAARLRAMGTRSQLAAITAAFTALLALWSVVMPLFEAPDERTHIDMVALRADGLRWPEYDQLQISVPSAELCHVRRGATWTCPTASEGAGRAIVRHAAADAPNKASDQTFEELGGRTFVPSFNQMLQHPTLYYEIQAKVIQAERALVPGEWSFAREIALMRLVSVLMMSPLPILCWWTARRLGLGSSTALVASLAPFVVPQLAHIGSVVNNDVLQIVLGATIIALCAGVVRDDRSWRTAVLLGLTAGAALLTKSSSFVFPLVIAAAYLVGWLRRTDRRDLLVADGLRLATAGLLTFALSGWWYIRNLARHGTVVPSIHSDLLSEELRPAGFQASPSDFAVYVVDKLPSRFWGHPGSFSVRMSWPLILGSTILLLVLLLIGFLARPRPEDAGASDGGGRRLRYAVLQVPVAALLVLVVSHSWQLYERSGRLAFMQGRYLFPGLAGPVLLLALGTRRLAGRFAAAAIGAWALVMHADALNAVIPTYWAGEGPLGPIRALVAWSPWPGPMLGLGAVLAGAAAVALLLVVVTEALGPPSTPTVTPEVDLRAGPDDRGTSGGPPGRVGSASAQPARREPAARR